MKPLFLILCFLTSIVSFSQTGTEEALEALNPKESIHFIIRGDKLYYEMDGNRGFSSHKLVKDKISVSVPKRQDQLILNFDFLNPFKYEIKLSESFENDPNFESLSSFIPVLVGLTTQISPTTTATSSDNKANGAAMTAGAAISTAHQQAIDDVSLLNSELLVEWKYLFIKETNYCTSVAL